LTERLQTMFGEAQDLALIETFSFRKSFDDAVIPNRMRQSSKLDPAQVLSGDTMIFLLLHTYHPSFERLEQGVGRIRQGAQVDTMPARFNADRSSPVAVLGRCSSDSRVGY
jgi:hypothetical protein